MLTESVFDPKKPGPLAIILEAHGDDPNYLESRAIELIKEAQFAMKDLDAIGLYDDKMRKANGLLLLARCIRANQFNESMASKGS
jgi:hypothetical protein